MQQIYYREYSSMKKGVERYLRSSRYLRIVRIESNSSDNSVVFILRLRASLANLLLLHEVFKLKIEKVDESVTRLEFKMRKKEPGILSFLTSQVTTRLSNFIFKF